MCFSHLFYAMDTLRYVMRKSLDLSECFYNYELTEYVCLCHGMLLSLKKEEWLHFVAFAPHFYPDFKCLVAFRQSKHILHRLS